MTKSLQIEKELIRERIQEKRGNYTKARKKFFLSLKHRGQLSQYYKQKAGIKERIETIKSSEGSGIPQTELKFFSRLRIKINLFLNKFYVKTNLRSLWSRDSKR